jgi:hypothetical protein
MRSRKHPMNKFLIIMIMTWGDMGEQSSKKGKKIVWIENAGNFDD